MMMQRADTNIPTCRSCFWFCYCKDGIGRCGNLRKMVDCTIYNLPYRSMNDSCDDWLSSHTDLTDDDLAEADRQAREIKEMKR